jgi:hypothetical protein
MRRAFLVVSSSNGSHRRRHRCSMSSTLNHGTDEDDSLKRRWPNRFALKPIPLENQPEPCNISMVGDREPSGIPQRRRQDRL